MTEYRAYRRALAIMAITCAIVIIAWSILLVTWPPAQVFLEKNYRILLWCALLPGLISSATFLIVHRPSRWFSSTSLNSVGWVVAIFLLYVRSAISLLLSHHAIVWRGSGNALNSLGFGLAIDFLLIYRLISYLQFRLTYRKSQRQLAEREYKRTEGDIK